MRLPRPLLARRALAVLGIAAVLAASPARPAAADPAEAVSYVPPADAPIADPFRPPPAPFAAGNRGIDLATIPGDDIRASAAGEVVFAGPVGGRSHVVVLHADGLRTSYSFLDRPTVGRGERVRQGQVIGRAAGPTHFGARAGDAYVDPAALLGAGAATVRLVPEPFRRPASAAEEQRWLRRLLAAAPGTAARVSSAAAAWARREATGALDMVRSDIDTRLDLARAYLHYVAANAEFLTGKELRDARAAWEAQRHDCTPSTVLPPKPKHRRIAVLVGGLGSSSTNAGITNVDPVALGYRAEDVIQLSYKGGDARANPYTSADTAQSLDTTAAHLAALLQEVRHDHPGVAVDVIAHSQGGVVTQATLGHHYDRNDPRYPPIGAVITMASPHSGADLATAAKAFGDTSTGEVVEALLDRSGIAPLPVSAPAVHDLAEHSDFMRKLRRTTLPPNVPITTIGVRYDGIVANGHTRLDGARNVVVDLGRTGGSHHAALPGSDAGRREVALALAGLPPTCQSLGDMLGDAAVSMALSRASDTVGQGLMGLGLWADSRSARGGRGLAAVGR